MKVKDNAGYYIQATDTCKIYSYNHILNILDCFYEKGN